jgi:DNA invertase Pin-like site-specific DNA recombinase
MFSVVPKRSNAVKKSPLTRLERSVKTRYDGYMTKQLPSKAIGYIRVSTQRQGQSGLGLSAQQAAIAEFCRANGLTLLREYREVESGRHNERPVLAQAIAQARACKGLLLIAKLDRLARDVHFISGLMKQVDFRACDYPDDDAFILHIRAAVAEDEARRISQRTKDGLQAAKRKGVKLGASNPACRNLTRSAARKGAKSNALKAREANAEATAIIRSLKHLTLAGIASELDARGIFTRTGRTWSAMQVSRLLAR